MLQFECLPFLDLSLQQLYELLKLRQAVFTVEQYCAYLDVDGKDYQADHLLGTAVDGRLGAYARLLGPGVSYPEATSIGRIVTAGFVRGQGMGQTLVRLGIEQLQSSYPTFPIRISAQQYLLRFYERLGFSADSQVYLEDGIPHLEMILAARG